MEARGPASEAALRVTTLGRDAKARVRRGVWSQFAIATQRRERGAGSGQRSSPTGHDSRPRPHGESEARGPASEAALRAPTLGRDAKARGRRGVLSRFSVATQRRERGEGRRRRVSASEAALRVEPVAFASRPRARGASSPPEGAAFACRRAASLAGCRRHDRPRWP